VVLPVSVMLDLVVVEEIEESRPSHHHLEGEGKSRPDWVVVLVEPAPVTTANSPTPVNGILAASRKPSRQLLHLDLAKRGVFCLGRKQQYTHYDL